MSSNSGKQYGLILSKKKKETQIVSKPSIFDSGSDSEKEDKIGKSIKKEFTKTQPKLKAQLEIQKVLDEDPTVYEYDSVYDDMKEKKEAKVSEITVDRKPKYIENLLKAADKRKKEYERRVERKIQKEREEEGEKFADKESFVTSAYKKKMQELQEEEEKEKRMDAIEAMMDVTKQKDLSGFYRHLLNREISGGEKPVLADEIKEEKPSSSEDEERAIKSDAHKSSSSKNLASTKDERKKVDDSEQRARETLQHLRKSKEPSSSSKPSVNVDNVDADSDFTNDSESSSSDSSDNEDDQRRKNKKDISKSRDNNADGNVSLSHPAHLKNKERGSSDSSDNGKDPSETRKERRRNTKSKDKKAANIMSSSSNSERKEDNSSPQELPKRAARDKDSSEDDSSSDSDRETSKANHKTNAEPVVSVEEKLRALFTKRTVGDAFTAAQERYWQRKRLRTSGHAAT